MERMKESKAEIGDKTNNSVKKAKTDPVIRYFGIEIVKSTEGETLIGMTVTDKCINYAGNLHGALYYSMADIVAGHHVHNDGRSHVTQNGNLNLLRGCSGGTVYAKGTFLHKGRKTSVIHVEIFDDKDRLLADGNYTYFCIGE